MINTILSDPQRRTARMLLTDAEHFGYLDDMIRTIARRFALTESCVRDWWRTQDKLDCDETLSKAFALMFGAE